VATRLFEYGETGSRAGFHDELWALAIERSGHGLQNRSLEIVRLRLFFPGRTHGRRNHSPDGPAMLSRAGMMAAYLLAARLLRRQRSTRVVEIVAHHRAGAAAFRIPLGRSACIADRARGTEGRNVRNRRRGASSIQLSMWICVAARSISTEWDSPLNLKLPGN